MKLHHLLFLSAFALFFGSCKSATSAGDSTTIQQLFPMLVGNVWTYNDLQYDQSGAVTGEDTTQLHITGKRNFAGNDAFFLAILGPGGPDSGLIYYAGSDLFSVSSLNQQVPRSQRVLRYPMAAGETLIMHDTTYADTSRSERVLVFRGAGESVTVPAGTFSCYHFDNISIYGKPSSFDTTSKEMLYFAPNIGYILDEYYSRSGGTFYRGSRTELKSYKLK